MATESKRLRNLKGMGPLQSAAVRELESGHHSQAVNTLCLIDKTKGPHYCSYCVLGIFHEVARLHGVPVWWEFKRDRWVACSGSGESVTEALPEVVEAFALRSSSGDDLFGRSLIEMNDGNAKGEGCMTFLEIAEAIRKSPVGFFTENR